MKFDGLLVSALLLSLSTASAQEGGNFFPLQQGNLWEHLYYDDASGYNTLKTRVVVDSTLPSGERYVRTEREHINPPSPVFCWPDDLVADTLGNIYATGCAVFDIRLYKLDANPGEIWIVDDLGGYYEIAQVESVFQDTLFGIPTMVKQIGYFGTADTSDPSLWLHRYDEFLADGFGTVFRGGGDLGYFLFSLNAAVINGIQYGDTTVVVSVGDEPDHAVAAAPLLISNYPNPFNSSTTIRFSIPRSGEVSLKIFNLLGEEVATLVLGDREAGTHAVQWDASGQPSGVYFYRLESGSFLQSKKLLLIR